MILIKFYFACRLTMGCRHPLHRYRGKPGGGPYRLHFRQATRIRAALPKRHLRPASGAGIAVIENKLRLVQLDDAGDDT